MRIILASKSPARKKLLSQLGLKFEVLPAEIDEDKIRESSPSATVKKIALEKAKKVLTKIGGIGGIGDIGGRNEEITIISADTMVYLPKANSQRLIANYIGKPKNKSEAKQILTTLSGTTHWLYSGLCVLQRRMQSRMQRKILNDKEVLIKYVEYVKSRVTFRELNEKEIDDYVLNENVTLWAGAYTIEKGTAGAGFIKKITGSNSNVLGLPVEKLKRILRGINVLMY